MKELAGPHNMWWREERPLQLAGLIIQPEVREILDDVVDASKFADWVRAGYQKLFSSDAYMAERGRRPLQEQLRILFSEQEVNISTDTSPLGNPKETVVRVPLGFFVDTRLLPDGPSHVEVPKTLYLDALRHFDSQFLDFQAGGGRPSDGIDADHGFATPVKAYSDMRLADALVARGLIDDEFVADVIAVDMTRPMFSAARRRLLLLLPDDAGADWERQFTSNLAESADPAARELLLNLTDPERTAEYHRREAEALLDTLRRNANSGDAVLGWVRLLSQRRVEVFQAEISQHPQGQIFEPDFRLLFPTLQRIKPDKNEVAYGGIPGQFWLNPDTGLAELVGAP